MRHYSPHRSSYPILQILLVAVLLATSGIGSALATQATPPTTPTTIRDTRLYIGHGAQLTADIPAQWRPDFSLEFDYVFRDAFIATSPLPARSSMFNSLETVCSYAAGQKLFQNHGEIEFMTWRDNPACIVRTIADAARDPVSLIFRHPDPAADGHNTYVVVTIDASHFSRITSTISFDPEKLTPEIYLSAALDFIQTHTLQRDAIDWPEVRAEAHSLVHDLVELGLEPHSQNLWVTHPAIEYVVDQLHQAGADGHNSFRPGGGSILPELAYVGPTGEQLPNGIGYVSVPGFGGDEVEAARFTTEIQTILANQAEHGTCGWIADLRGNTGGNMYPMLRGLSPLLPPGELIGFRNANGLEFQVTLQVDGTLAYVGGPYDNEPVTWGAPEVMTIEAELARQPLAVLIGPQNSSSGEATALAFSGRDRTRFFGEPTFGVATSPAYLYLFDGALLSITTEWTVGPQGAIYPDGVHPDVTISPSDVVAPLAEDPVVQAATEWLTNQSDCEADVATPAG